MLNTVSEPVNPDALADIDQSLMQGVAWMGLVKWSGQLVAWVSTFFVAGLLTPDDYGLMGMATLYLGFLTIISEFGIGSAIITLRTLTQNQIQQINTVSVMFGVIGYIISCALAQLIGSFFRAPQLPLIIVILSITFFIASFRSVPWALLQRDMRFKRVAAFEGIQSVALAIISIVLAFLGFRYWTLVVAAILSSIIATGFALSLHHVGFAKPKWIDLRQTLNFSKEILLQRVAWFTYSNSDFFMAARLLGQSANGAYTLGWTLANSPLDKIGMLVLQVTPSVFSTVQTDRAALARYTVMLTEGIAFVIFPMLFGLAVVAPEFVPLVIGKQWNAMVIPLQLLSLYSCFRAILPLLSQVLMVTGGERFAARNMLLAAMILPIAFYIGGKYWGLTGIAMAWIIAHPLIAYRLCTEAVGKMELRLRDVLVYPVWRTVVACLAMTGAVLMGRRLIPMDWIALARLLSLIGIGATVYAACIALLYRRRFSMLRSFITTMRERVA